MSKTILILLLLSSCFIKKGYGQKEWAPIGAKWYINVSVNNGNGVNEPPLKDYYILESTKDTLINSDVFRLVGDFPMLQDGGDIFYYYRDTLRLIYSFDVDVNDTIIFNMLDCFGNGINLPYKVDLIDSIYFDNDTLKKITCKTLTDNFLHPQTYEYIEKIGSTRTLIEDLAGCAWIPESTPEWLRCYEDNTIFYKTSRYSDYDFDCDYIEPISDIPSNFVNSLKVFPNPVHDLLIIDCKYCKGMISVFTLTGNKILSELIDKDTEINLRELESGVYILCFQSVSGEINNMKIVKY